MAQHTLQRLESLTGVVLVAAVVELLVLLLLLLRVCTQRAGVLMRGVVLVRDRVVRRVGFLLRRQRCRDVVLLLLQLLWLLGVLVLHALHRGARYDGFQHQ
jgi:hypothetical protein